MSLIKCPKCGEMFSDSYKTCPFCEEDEAYYSGKARKGRGRRTAESSRRRAPSILGPVAVVVLILLVVLVVWLIFGDRIKEAIDGSEKPPITNVDTPDDSPVTTPDDTAVTPTISLNRTVLVLSIGDKESLKVNGTEETVAWSSSDPTVASVTSSGDVTALTKGNAVITAAVGEESVACTVTVKSEDDTSGDNSTTTTKPNDTTKPGDTTTTKPSTGSVDVSKLTLESEYGTTIKPNDGTFDISLPAGLKLLLYGEGHRHDRRVEQRRQLHRHRFLRRHGKDRQPRRDDADHQARQHGGQVPAARDQVTGAKKS